MFGGEVMLGWRRAMRIEQLGQAERHVRAARRHIARQQAMVAKLALAGHDTTEARASLQRLAELLAAQITARDRIRAEADELKRDR